MKWGFTIVYSGDLPNGFYKYTYSTHTRCTFSAMKAWSPALQPFHPPPHATAHLHKIFKNHRPRLQVAASHRHRSIGFRFVFQEADGIIWWLKNLHVRITQRLSPQTHRRVKLTLCRRVDASVRERERKKKAGVWLHKASYRNRGRLTRTTAYSDHPWFLAA